MKTKKITAVLLAVMLLLSLCACGASANKESYHGYTSSAPAGGYANYAAADEADYAAAPYVEEPAEAPSPVGGLASSDGGGTASPQAGEISADKIIYSASATIETTAFEQTLADLGELVRSYGGFIESSSVSGSNYYNSSRGYTSYRSASYQIRIPSASFGEVMESLTTLGNVPYTNTYTENITSQYYDVQARLNACRAEEQSLLEMMEKAETVTELLEIQEYLADVRYRIESLQSKLNNWDRQVSYSTISLSVQEVLEYTPESKITFGEQLSLALSRGLKSLGEFFRDLLLWLTEALPALVILAVFVVLVLVAVRRARRRAKARKKAAAAVNAPQDPSGPPQA